MLASLLQIFFGIDVYIFFDEDRHGGPYNEGYGRMQNGVPRRSGEVMNTRSCNMWQPHLHISFSWSIMALSMYYIIFILSLELDRHG